MVGQDAAQKLNAEPAATDAAHGGHEPFSRWLGGDGGGSEDSQVFVSLAAAQSLAGLGDHAALAQSACAHRTRVESVMKRLTAALPGPNCGRVRQLSPAKARCWNDSRICLPRCCWCSHIGAGRAGGAAGLAIDGGATLA